MADGIACDVISAGYFVFFAKLGALQFAFILVVMLPIGFVSLLIKSLAIVANWRLAAQELNEDLAASLTNGQLSLRVPTSSNALEGVTPRHGAQKRGISSALVLADVRIVWL